jgi:dTDP-4-dehydrorhamnose 3,5-epimerase
MRFTPLSIPGAHLIDVEPHRDDRGFFARTWCAREFAEHGLAARLAQSSVSFNEHAGTLRGLHYQAAPHEEAKLVRCTHGAIFDVIVDLRPSSPSFRTWVGAELSAGNRRMLYVPEGVAHGFQTLEPASEVLYLISEFYAPETARGVRWDDPAFGIAWPAAERRIISDRDRAYPDFQP